MNNFLILGFKYEICISKKNSKLYFPLCSQETADTKFFKQTGDYEPSNSDTKGN